MEQASVQITLSYAFWGFTGSNYVCVCLTKIDDQKPGSGRIVYVHHNVSPTRLKHQLIIDNRLFCLLSSFSLFYQILINFFCHLLFIFCPTSVCIHKCFLKSIKSSEVHIKSTTYTLLNQPHIPGKKNMDLLWLESLENVFCSIKGDGVQ